MLDTASVRFDEITTVLQEDSFAAMALSAMTTDEGDLNLGPYTSIERREIRLQAAQEGLSGAAPEHKGTGA